MPTLQSYLNQASVKTNKTEGAREWIKKEAYRKLEGEMEWCSEAKTGRIAISKAFILTVSPEQCHRAISLKGILHFLGGFRLIFPLPQS